MANPRQRGGGRGRRGEDREPPEFEERLVGLRRCAKVVKGGKNFSFSALVVVGNRKGKVGIGLGKANEATDAIRKGGELARKSLVTVHLDKTTIPHEVESKFRGAKVIMRPAAPGTGLIAGGGMRAVLDLAGVSDILCKSLGSSNKTNIVWATMRGLEGMLSKEDALRKRDLQTL